MEIQVEERLEEVITNTTNNNDTIAPLATKPVTPEKDRKKKESESQSETESTGLCGGRRYVSDLNSLDPTTKFPTNWMSDRADYDSEATVDDNERYCLDKSESGDVRAINVKDDVDFLRQRLLAEEKEKEILDAAIEKKNPEKCGLQYWEKRGQTQQLMNSVCCHSTYVKKKRISRRLLVLVTITTYYQYLNPKACPVLNYSDSDASKIRTTEKDTTKQKPWCVKKDPQEKDIFLLPLAGNISSLWSISTSTESIENRINGICQQEAT